MLGFCCSYSCCCCWCCLLLLFVGVDALWCFDVASWHCCCLLMLLLVGIVVGGVTVYCCWNYCCCFSLSLHSFIWASRSFKQFVIGVRTKQSWDDVFVVRSMSDRTVLSCVPDIEFNSGPLFKNSWWISPSGVSWPVVHKVPCESLFGILDFVPKSIGISLELLGYWTVEQKPNVS